MINWWNRKIIISPNHKDVVRKRIGVKFYESHAIHYLQVSKIFVFFIFWGFQQLFHCLLNFVDDAIIMWFD